MGNYTSKFFPHHVDHESKTKTQAHVSSCGIEKLKMCTPPISKREFAMDPRSATMGIARTPIEVTCTPPGLTRRVASALPKYLQGKRYLETDFDVVTPVTPERCIPDPRSPSISHQRTPIIVKTVSGYLTPIVTINEAPNMDTPVGSQMIMSSLDPRSPATDFDRTPILKQKSVEHIHSHSHENVNEIDNNIYSSRMSYCETTTDYSIPEIQTISEHIPVTDHSLSIQNRVDVCEGSSGSTLSRNSSVEEISEGSETEEQVTVIRNPKVLSPWSHVLSTWAEDKAVAINSNVFESNDELNESEGNILKDNISELINSVMKTTINEQKVMTNNDKIKVWRDSVSPNFTDETRFSDCKDGEKIIIEFDDELITTTPKVINAAKMPVKAEEEKAKNQVKKRKTQQQYTKGENKAVLDERKTFNNEGKNSVDVGKNRTPLGNRSNNPKLVLAKSPQQILRNKALSTRAQRQENTPPQTERFVSKTKSNGIQWDPDTTVII